MALTQWTLSARDDRLVRAYLDAKAAVIDAGYAWEIDWQDDVSPDDVTETTFLRETAWVILSSGMRTSVVAGIFQQISRSFLDWTSGCAIQNCREKCRQGALSVFAHEGKVEAILAVAQTVCREGFQHVFGRVKQEGIAYLQTFPYLGPATSRHLAKNLGFNVVKPDRHLVRIARAAGFSSPDQFCEAVSHLTGEKMSVVDAVVWRFATLDRRCVPLFQNPNCDDELEQRYVAGRAYRADVCEGV